MTIKVLVFESDPAFAGELRTQLDARGCTTTVVEDGNVGLQQATSDPPDLVLLSIELPRMNGFSVCNKLKKDPALKDVPLIIMSSESSDETFEQHKKLRTRANDYVHKPIAFDELLGHIQPFVHLGAAAPEGEGPILIEDEIEVGSDDYLLEDDDVQPVDAAAPEAGSLAEPAAGEHADAEHLEAEPVEAGELEAEPVEDDGEAPADAVLTPDAEVESSEIDAVIEMVGEGAATPAASLEGGGYGAYAAGGHAASFEPESPAQASAEALAARDVEPDLEDAAESAFGRMTMGRTPPPSAVALDPPRLPEPPRAPVESRFAPERASGETRGLPNGSFASDLAPPRSISGSLSRRSSFRPPGLGGDPVENERLRAELVVLREQLETSQRDLGESRRDADKLRLEAAETGRLAREVDELRAKLAAAAKAGGISSRDFLDLREALNKKDKEILSFREQLSRKDRDIVEAQDRALGLERSKADLEERLLVVERQLAETRDAQEGMVAERDAAKRAADENRGRFEKARGDVEARVRQVSEIRARSADERAANEVKFAAIRAELDQILANERAEHARALDQAEQRRRADVEQLRREREGALVEARDKVEREMRDALSAQAAGLRQEHDGKLSALARAHMQEIDRTRAEAAEEGRAALDEQRFRHAEELRGLGEERDARVAAVEARLGRDLSDARDATARTEAELTALRIELQALVDRKRSEEAVSQSRVAELEHRLAELQGARDALDQGLAAASDHAAALQSELESVRRELAEAKDRLSAEVSRGDHTRAKWDADRQSLDRAKDALALALAQIEETEARPLT